MHVPIKVRLALLLFIPMAFFVATAVYLLVVNNNNIDRMKSGLYDTAYSANNLVMAADRDMYQALNDYYLLRIAQLSDETKKTMAQQFEDNVKRINDEVNQATDVLKKQDLLSFTNEGSPTTIGQMLDQFQGSFKDWSAKALANIQSGKAADNEQDEVALSQLFESGRGSVKAIGDALDRYAKVETQDVRQKSDKTATSMYICLGIEWTIIIVAGIWLIRNLGITLNNVLNKTKMVAGGNLQYIPMRRYGRDELGQINQSVDTMIERMRGLVGRILDSTQSVSASAVELSVSARESAAASGHVAENINEVTSQIELQSTIADETSRAVEEMAVGVQRIAENTNAISSFSTQTSEQVESGNERVLELKKQLQSISDAIASLSRTVVQLTNKSEKIGQITENITGFANRTNILSLNASIEAARAGEHGKGFAVVAQEIRKLAAGSVESAEVISELIAETRAEIGNASSYMESTIGQAVQVDRMMSDVERDFSDILQAVKQVTVQVHETSAITQQMSASSEEVSASMDQSANTARDIAGKAQTVAAATEEQLALVESISHSSDQLQDIVRDLKDAVNQFKL